MKLLVTCDQAFDVLTRGPFPSGSPDDDAVQKHLDVCHECRQLAEALRPALDLMHEALPAGEAAELPLYGAADEDDRLCQRADGALAARIRLMMDRQEVQPRRITRDEKWLHALRLVAASALLVALGTLVAGVLSRPKDSDADRLAMASPRFGTAHQPTAEGLMHLTALRLPRTCLPGMPAPAMQAGHGVAMIATYACCTRCHAAGKHDAPPLTERTIAALQTSCTACHEARS